MDLGAVLFDLDGTLVDSERESAEAMARALERGLGVQVTQADRDGIIGRSWVQIYDDLSRAHGALAWTIDELIAATTAARAEVFRNVGITVLPGARAVVERFAAVPRAVVTGSSRGEARQALEALGLVDVLDPIIASEDVPRSKPAPDGYRRAAERIGVDVAACLVIEDSHAGIAAGRAAGAQVVAVRAGNFANHDQTAAHRVVETLDEVTWELVRGL